MTIVINEKSIRGKKHKLPDNSVVELFTIAVLARALDRDVMTIRRWEKYGKLPRPLFSNPDRPSLRYYSAEQITTAHKLYKFMGCTRSGGRSTQKHFSIFSFLEVFASVFFKPKLEMDELTGLITWDGGKLQVKKLENSTETAQPTKVSHERKIVFKKVKADSRN